MKINVLSDLHLGVGEMGRPLNDADLVVLAGDIGPPRQALAWALRLGKPVLHVLGNHEFYGGSIDLTADDLKRLCAGTRVHLLERQHIHPRFAGSPLNACFVSAAERLVGAEPARVWIHGHTHDSFDYELQRHPRGLQPARLCQGGCQREPALRSGFHRRALTEARLAGDVLTFAASWNRVPSAPTSARCRCSATASWPGPPPASSATMRCTGRCCARCSVKCRCPRRLCREALRRVCSARTRF